MESEIRPIAIVQGAESSAIQRLFRMFVERQRASARIVGLLEDACDTGGGSCGPGRLMNIADGLSYPLFQDLGIGSTACSLDAGGVILAGAAVCRDIAAGCDGVVLSKFGKLEAENRSGLIPAFAAAIEAGVPVLTSVSPKFAAAWSAFAAPLYVTLPADMDAIETWWSETRMAVAPPRQ